MSYAPNVSSKHGAGGIRTHGLELMRLARTAAPLPRYGTRSGRLESNQRSPVPETGGVASPLQPDEYPRRDLNPRLRVENPASQPLDHGGMWISRRSWNRTRPCSVSASRAATDTDLRREELRRQGSNLLFAINSRASYPFDLAGTLCSLEHRAEGEGVEPPTAEAAPVFETGYRASGSPSKSGPGRTRTCNPPIKSRQLCRVELRSR